LRVSPWARTVYLRVGLQGALEVIAPRRIGRRTIARLLAQEKAWIDTALAEAEARRRTLPPPPVWTVPPTIALPAVGAHWTLTLHPTMAPGVRVRPNGAGQLVLAGQVGNGGACRQALRRWLLREGDAHLLPRLAALSQASGLAYRGATVRLARRRWGSCSRQGSITLTARLLLLAPPLVEYVLLHELCHAEEPNHSPAFWDLVAQHCPAYRQRRIALRAAGKDLPAWVEDLGRRHA
jgi:predicted metal-dependent hydrolase